MAREKDFTLHEVLRNYLKTRSWCDGVSLYLVSQFCTQDLSTEINSSFSDNGLAETEQELSYTTKGMLVDVGRILMLVEWPIFLMLQHSIKA